MANPTINDVQAVEPILTNLLVGYKQSDSRFVASRVFPAVTVDKDSGTYYIFTKKYWFTDEMERRAPGQQYARAEFGIETSTYKTDQWALSYPIADETRANSQVPMDLEQVATRWLAQKSLLRKERQFAADWMITGVWGSTASGSSTAGAANYKWDNASSDPVKDIQLCKRTISNDTGVDANAMVLGYIVHTRLTNHPDILDRIKYTTQANQGNVESALGALFGVSNYLVAKATYANINEADDFASTAIIDDDCLVTYIASNPGLFEPSAGYTFNWAPGGGTGVIKPVFRDEANDSDLIKTKEQWDQKAVATDLGYMLLDICD